MKQVRAPRGESRDPARGRAAGAPLPRGVCLLTADIDSPTGGLQAQTRLLLRELSRRGVATYVCTRNYGHLPRCEIQDGSHFQRSPVLRRSLRALNSAVYLADAVGWLVRHRDRYEVIHCQQMFGAALAGLTAGLLLDKPVLVRVSSTGELGEVADLRRIPLSRLRLPLLRRVDCWVALTRLMEREILTLGVPAQRVRIIPNAAVPPTEAAYDRRVRAKHRARLRLPWPRLVLYSGRLSSEKNLDVLLRAWKLVAPRFPDAHLALLGAGGAFRNVEGSLRELRDQLGLTASTHLLGHVDNVVEYLLAADLFVLPTSTEGMSNALLEAMAAGTAIVTTDIEPNRELLQPGVHARLVPPRDAAALAAAIGEVLADDALRDALGRAARRRARAELSVTRMVDSYLEAYRELLRPQREREARP